eukprot:gnl/MRDRNA2_/MRDRNA2_57741_c0_seq1.p1 gnl/MRDRNA2_/MRDRNA2_57741_c0~~gnl/MRDRNA2_/MRDRNA2_57741_c0_seq1.p1  ORF type:complete len:407 (+),score=34.17 gnl/MRDRNA2_/MRDRNA2_57741_c0_seq1:90-1310(+)
MADPPKLRVASIVIRIGILLFAIAYLLSTLIWIPKLSGNGCWGDGGQGPWRENAGFFCEKSNSSTCYSDWSLIEGRCYKYLDIQEVQQEVDFDAAQHYCKGQDANLATVPSGTVNMKLFEMCGNETSSLTHRCYIGLYGDRPGPENDKWRWLADRTQPTYTNWCSEKRWKSKYSGGGCAFMFHKRVMDESDDCPRVFLIVLILACICASALQMGGIRRNDPCCLCASTMANLCFGFLSFVWGLVFVLAWWSESLDNDEGTFRYMSAAAVMLLGVSMCLAAVLGCGAANASEDGPPLPVVACTMGQPTNLAEIVLTIVISRDNGNIQACATKLDGSGAYSGTFEKVATLETLRNDMVRKLLKWHDFVFFSADGNTLKLSDSLEGHATITATSRSHSIVDLKYGKSLV